MDLASRKCVPCEGGIPKLGREQIVHYHPAVSEWTVEEDLRLKRSFRFANFVEAIAFINRVAELAEREGHHPDFCVHYNRVDFTLWTHAVNGLSENDFVLAAKIDQIA